MNRPFLLRATFAFLLALCGFALGQGADTNLQVPGAKYVAAASHGFDALAGGSACASASDQDASRPSVVRVSGAKA